MFSSNVSVVFLDNIFEAWASIMISFPQSIFSFRVLVIMRPRGPVILFKICSSIFDDFEIIFSSYSQIDGTGSFSIFQNLDGFGLGFSELQSIS